MPDWEGPKYKKPPKEKSSRPDGKTVGMAVALFWALPVTVVSVIGLYLAHGYHLI